MAEIKYERIKRAVIDCSHNAGWPGACGDYLIFENDKHKIWANCTWLPTSWTLIAVPYGQRYGTATIWIDVMRVDMQVEVVQIVYSELGRYVLTGHTIDKDGNKTRTVITLDVDSEAIKLKHKVLQLEKELNEVKNKLKVMGY